jgi:predicted ATP-grasp superfamily ATP-dependent carboligase
MANPHDLYQVLDASLDVPMGLHLVAGLTGFTDAGSTVNQFAENIFANFDYELLVEFQNDELLDYRARRPVMYFEKDHISEYEPASLGIYLVFDEARAPFLFLHGYEPDFRWDAFAEAILQLLETFEVSDVTWVHAIPFPIPHTRPVGVTVSGNRKDVIDAISEWKPQTQVPGNVLHLIEFRVAEIGMPITGIVLLVPHYLGDSEYPTAAVAAFEQVSALTGLIFKTDPLREEARRFVKKLAEQIEENPELARVVASLEQGYQNERSGPGRSPVSKKEQPIPSADEIAAELEDYLTTRNKNHADNDEI